ncbi:CoA-transferase family III domain-containing protein [Xylaria digitata]|nr:CoA-transferase family III domain-containing protein [Xylaria digitata]
MVSPTEYSVPHEAKSLFEDGILRNPLQKNLPSGLEALAKHVHFEGSSKPSVPINWRFAESISALKAFEATMLNLLVSRKYNVEPSDVTINTDHATLFFMSPLVAKWLKDGQPTQIDVFGSEMAQIFPNRDLHRSVDGLHRALATNIYKTKGGKCYHIHGSMNPDQTLTALGLPLFEKADDTYDSVTGSQPAAWWPKNDSYPPSPKRPLAGLKVVDLCRVIAGPAIARGLAEMGARKWNASLHLKDEADKEKLRALIREADVVVDGYRPGVMERLGFGREALFDLVKGRERGIIHVRENCYGWHGPWSHRSGWQQISDACCGVSRSYAKAMGNDETEAVTPVFPNSDYCTGVAGSTAVLEALIKRAQDGGSYSVDVSLNYYSQWLVRSCGTYSDEVWRELWQRHGSPTFRHYHAMFYLLPAMMKLLAQHDSETLFNPKFFLPMTAKHLKTTFVRPKPVAHFASGVELKYHVGTRGNGVDQPVWPNDLTVEVVTGDN